MYRTRLPFLLGALALAACAPAVSTAPGPARSPTAAYPHTEADVAFMAGMIHHHAQAILMAGWSPARQASHAVQTLSERIVVGQRDEIVLMQQWLRDRNLPAPQPDTAESAAAAMDHSKHMPGMLHADELARLKAARGPEYDRLFLSYMIRHHQGALTMVDALFASQGAGQDETVYRIAADIHADQEAEINRMQRLLLGLPAVGTGP